MIRILIGFCVLFTAKSFSQETILLKQETIDTLQFIGNTFRYENAILHTIKTNKHIKGWSKYYLVKSYRCLVERKNDSSLFYANKAIEVFHEKEQEYQPSAGLIHKAYYIKGLREFFKKKYISAVNSFNTGLYYIEAFPKCFDGNNWASYIYSFLGASHYEMGDTNLALFYKKKVLFDVRMKHKYFAATSFINIGELFSIEGQIDSAKKYTYKALRVLNDTTIKHSGYNSVTSLNLNRVGALNNLGDYYYLEHNIDSALRYYEKAQKEFVYRNLDYKEKRTSRIKFFTKANFAYLKFKQGDVKSSIPMLTSIIDSINQFESYTRENKRLYTKVYGYLKQIYLQEKDYEHLISMDQNMLNYLEKYNEESITKQLQLLSIEFEAKNKDRQIETLSQDFEKQITRTKEYKLMAVLLTVLVALFLMFLVYYKKTKEKQEAYEKESLKQRLMLLQMNPHFLFNTFSAINGKIVNGSNNTVDYVSKLSFLFRKILSNSEEEFVSLEDEILLLTNYLEIQSDFLEKFTFKIHIENYLNKELTLIPPMLIQPLLENAIVHGIKGEDGIIEVRIKKDDLDSKLITVEICDNGIGFNDPVEYVKKPNSSFSITLIRERLNTINKRYHLKTTLKYLEVKNGTVAHLSLPLFIDH